jgi:hypothetical protein
MIVNHAVEIQLVRAIVKLNIQDVNLKSPSPFPLHIVH